MLRVVWLAGLMLISLAVQAVEDPWLALQKTAQAARELNYQGVFVYQNGLQVRSVQITHMNHAGQEMAHNVVLGNHTNAEQPREVYSQGKEILILHPVQQKVMIEKRRGQNLFPAMLPTDLSALKTSYSAVFSGTDNIAGRAAQIIELVPNDMYRYHYKVWADVELGLLLKMTLNNAQNETLEQIAFNQVSMLNSTDLDWFKPKMDVTKNYVTQTQAPVQHVAQSAIAVQLPPGYRQVDHIERKVPGKVAPVNQMVFSDGLASVSLFIEPVAKGARPKTGHTLMGSTNMCAKVVDGHQVIVVGEVPAATVQQISKTVSFK